MEVSRRKKYVARLEKWWKDYHAAQKGSSGNSLTTEQMMTGDVSNFLDKPTPTRMTKAEPPVLK